MDLRLLTDPKYTFKADPFVTNIIVSFGARANGTECFDLVCSEPDLVVVKADLVF